MKVGLVLVVHILCLVLCLVGVVIVSTLDIADSAVFCLSCSVVIVAAAMLMTRANSKSLAAVVVAFAFFWFPFGVVLANNARQALDYDEDDKDAQKALAGTVLCLIGSAVAPLLSVGASLTPRLCALSLSHILGLLGLVLAAIGLFLAWKHEGDHVSELTIQGLVALVLGLYSLLYPWPVLTHVCIFLVGYVGCLALYSGLDNKNTDLGDAYFLLASGLWILMVASVWATDHGQTDKKVTKGERTKLFGKK